MEGRLADKKRHKTAYFISRSALNESLVFLRIELSNLPVGVQQIFIFAQIIK